MKCQTLFLTVAAAALVAGFGVRGARAEPAPVLLLGTHVLSQNGTATVRAGDTVWRIAARYDLPADDIIRTNNLHAPYTLTIGQRLVLPEARRHKVGKNDTVYRLARMYGVSVNALIAANDLKPPYTLHIGQTLRIPHGDSRTRTARVAQPPHQERPAPQPYHAVRKTAERNQNRAVRHQRKEASLIAPARAAPEPVVTINASHRAGFIWPVHGKVISSYGAKEGGLYNDGINIAAPRSAPVRAAADGRVIYVGNTLKSYGNLILIRHAGGMVTAYAHLNTIAVRTGQSVERGQTIGSVGSTGTVSSAQLHFEVRSGTQTINPLKYLG